MLISMIIFVVVAILAAYIASNNLAIMDINLLGYPLRAPGGVLLAASAGIGFVLGALLMLPAVISKSWAVIRHRRKIQDLQDAQVRAKKEPTMEEVEED